MDRKSPETSQNFTKMSIKNRWLSCWPVSRVRSTDSDSESQHAGLLMIKQSIITIIITVSWIPFYSQSILFFSITSKRHTRVFVVLEECFDNRHYHCSSLHIYSSSQKHLFFLQFYLRWVGLLHLLLLQQFNGTVLENWRHGCIFFFRLIGNSFGGSFWQTSSSPSNINLTLLVLHVLRNPACFLS